MGNNPANVTTSKPKVAGAIHIAPYGTALPTDAVTPLSSAFKCMGFVSQDGVSEDVTKTMNKFKDWGGDIVLSAEESFENTYKYKLLEVLNVDVLRFGFGDENVTGTLESGLTVTKKAGNDTPRVIVIESILNGNIAKRTVIPQGVLSGIGTIVQKKNDLQGIDCTIDCIATSSGATSFDYYKKNSAQAAKLASLSLGTLTLTPEFSADVLEYSATTENATNTITAAGADGATVAILNGDTPVESGSAATWAEGVNTVTITVSKEGRASTVYTVTVTKE